MGEATPSLSWVPADDVPVRYAELSHDHSPVHLDPELAVGEGLPGIILHGMHVLAQVASHLDRLGEAEGQGLRSLSMRFMDVTVRGERITVDFERSGDAVTFVGFQTGRAVAGTGTAEYGSPVGA